MTTMHPSSHRRGFTLLETLVTIVIYSVVMIAAAELLRWMYLNTVQEPKTIYSIDSARTVTTTFTSELRDAAYGADGSFPLMQASTSQIIFFSPYGNATSTYRIRYYISNSTLYKGVTRPSGSPASYNTASEITTPLIYNIANGTSSLFLYYGGTYGGTTTPLTQPVNVNQVTFVQMNIIARLNEVRNATTTFVITTGAAIRNLKTNLGN